MPSSFAEIWLRIYTKEAKFFGLIQAAYRYVLRTLQPSDFPEDQRMDIDHGSPPLDDIVKKWVPPSTLESPSTPRTFSRNSSVGSLAERRSSTGNLAPSATTPGRQSRPFGRTPSFSDNQFTTVPPNFRDPSPSRKPRSKRMRDSSDNIVEGARPTKNIRIASNSSAP